MSIFTQVKPLGKGVKELRLKCNMYCPCRNCGELGNPTHTPQTSYIIGIHFERKKVQASAITLKNNLKKT